MKQKKYRRRQAMTKAATIDRIALTRQKMEARERIKANAHSAIPEKYTKENSPFMKMVAEMKQERPEEFKVVDVLRCPECGGELEPWEGCFRCKQCGTSLCG